MKKVLLASTALVAMAGAAAAQSTIQGAGGSGRSGTISIRGDAEMGLIGGSQDVDITGGGTVKGDDIAPQFWNDLDLRFILRGETDGGLQFGAQVDLDEAPNLGNQTRNQGTDVFISGAFGRLQMGDTDGAVDFVITDMGDLPGTPGAIADDHTSHGAYFGAYGDGLFGGDNQVLRYDNKFGAITVALSIEQYAPGATGFVPDPDFSKNDFNGLSWAIGGKYTFDLAAGSVDVALGYKAFDNPGNVGLPFGVTARGNGLAGADAYAGAVGVPVFGSNIFDSGVNPVTDGIGDGSMITIGASVVLDAGFSAGMSYSTFQFDNLREDLTHLGLGAAYGFDAFSVGVNYGQWEIEDVSLTGWGLAASYNLGGGANLLFGYGNTSSDDFNLGGDARADDFSTNTYSFGLSLAF